MKAWLAPYTWDFVTLQNQVLCEQKNAFHGPTSDGHAETKALWSDLHQNEMTLSEASDLCRRCHRLAPFCFYNGNTFAAIMRDVIVTLDLDPEQAFLIRSLAGHIVAGVSTGEEEAAFREFSERLG